MKRIVHRDISRVVDARKTEAGWLIEFTRI